MGARRFGGIVPTPADDDALWSELRGRIPESVEYRTAAQVTEVLPEPDGAEMIKMLIIRV